METTPKTKTLLSTKNQKLHWRGQIQSLVRISKRAWAKAEWLEKLGAQNPEFASSPSEIQQYRDKAAAAMEEALAIAKANGDDRVRNF